MNWITIATAVAVLIAIGGPMFLMNWDHLPRFVRYALWIGDAIAIVGALLWLAFA